MSTATPKTVDIVTLSAEQVAQALADYCIAHRLIEPRGPCQLDTATFGRAAIDASGATIDHVRLRFEWPLMGGAST